MLTILGRPHRHRFCDGLTGRSFLKIGALGMGAGALTLADVLRAESVTGAVRHLIDGAGHMPQMERPAEVQAAIEETIARAG